MGLGLHGTGQGELSCPTDTPAGLGSPTTPSPQRQQQRLHQSATLPARQGNVLTHTHLQPSQAHIYTTTEGVEPLMALAA